MVNSFILHLYIMSGSLLVLFPTCGQSEKYVWKERTSKNSSKARSKEGSKMKLSPAGNFKPQTVNEDIEQVPYTVLQKFDGYEKRVYPSVTWACTEMTYEWSKEEDGQEIAGTDQNVITMVEEMMRQKSWKNKPSSKMFMKLFRYISGVNDQTKEIKMTAPVLSRLKLLENNFINMQMCFYLEKKHQDNPPNPVDKDITVGKKKEMTVLVHTFGGYAMMDSTWKREAEKFKNKLKKTSKSINFSEFYTAGYDSPWKFWNRTNEVMFEDKF